MSAHRQLLVVLCLAACEPCPEARLVPHVVVDDPTGDLTGAPEVPSERGGGPLERLAGVLERTLGPPRRPGLAVARLEDGADLTALRRATAELLSRWFDPTQATKAEEQWFREGLFALLALSAPTRAGLSDRDWALGIEANWIDGSSLHRLDVRRPITSDEHRQMRRAVATVLVHELERRLAGYGGLAALLEGWDGTGLPSPRTPAIAALFDEFTLGQLDHRRGPLSFEPAWELALSPAPATSPDDGELFPFHVGFTADTRSGRCGCAFDSGDEIPVINAEAARLRRRDPLLVDLGGHVPLGSDRVGVDADDAELAAWTAAMVTLGYDAVVVGPDELYTGIEALRGAGSPLPLVGAGVTVDGTPPFPDHVLVERGGRRVGFVGLSNHVEFVPRHGPHEANARGVSFARDATEVVGLLEELRPAVDLLIVGGTLVPEVIRTLADPALGVDAVLVSGPVASAAETGAEWGFLNDTLVMLDPCRGGCLAVTTLYLSGSGRVVHASVEAARRRSEPNRGELHAGRSR